MSSLLVPPGLHLQDFETFLQPLLAAFQAQRRGDAETFGDFCARVGFDALRQFQADAAPVAEAAAPAS